jgi:hypothetical protein
MTRRVNVISQPLAGVIDPDNPNGATFPDLNDPAPLGRLRLQLELTQTKKILPEPCDFLFRESLPLFGDSPYIHRARRGALATVKSSTADGLGQRATAKFAKQMLHMP